MQSFLKNQRGNLTLFTALTLVPLIGAAGMSIDYARLVKERTLLNSITDAAVLAAVSSAEQADADGLSTADVVDAARAAALKSWESNGVRFETEVEGDPSIKVVRTGQHWSASVTYSGVYRTTFMAVLGIDKMALDSHAEASGATTLSKDYWQLSVVVDVSNSMGIGATKSDMDALQANMQINCTFACHSPAGSIYKNTVDIAHAAGIKLRIDIVDSAIDALASTISGMTDNDTYVKTRLIGIERDAKELVALTPTPSKISDYKLQLVEAKLDGTMSTGDSNYRASLAKVTSMVGAADDGSSAGKPRKAVFLITDGIHDSNIFEENYEVKWTNKHYLGPIDPDFCADMKSKGVMVGVLYIDYIAPYGYEKYFDPFQSMVLPSLKACASSEDLFFNATSEEGITQALQDMLQAAITRKMPRLTQ